MSEPSFACAACGAAFGVAARVERALAGSKGDPCTPHLCWVCAHLRLAAHGAAVGTVEIDVRLK